MFLGIFCFLLYFFLGWLAASESIVLFPQICQFSRFFFCCWFLTSSHCGQRRNFVWDLSLKIHWNLTCALTYYLRCRMSCALGKHACTVDVEWRVLHVSVQTILFKLYFFTLPSHLLSGEFHPYWEWDTYISNYYFRSSSPFNSVSLCFIYFSGLFLGA